MDCDLRLNVLQRAFLGTLLLTAQTVFWRYKALSGFTKDAQWRIGAEKAWAVICAPDLMEYAFVGVSLSDATFMRSVLKLISQRDLLTIAIVDSQGTAEMKGEDFIHMDELIWKEHIIRTYRFPSHVIFYLLQEIKDDFEPTSRSHAIPALTKINLKHHGYYS